MTSNKAAFTRARLAATVQKLNLRPDYAEAARFLSIIAGDETVTFQTLSDSEYTMREFVNRNSGKKVKYDPLALVFHGDFASYAAKLGALNMLRAGVFFMVNAGDGITTEHAKTCRTAANVNRVRRPFIGLDGAPLEPVMNAPILPEVVTESSPGRWHIYYNVNDCTLVDFPAVQVALATRFNGDPSVCDLPRVMRIPGFLHQKGHQPFQSRIIRPAHGHEAASEPISLATLIEALGLEVSKRPQPSMATRRSCPSRRSRRRRSRPDLGRFPQAAAGERNTSLTKLAGYLIARGHSLDKVIEHATTWNDANPEPLDDHEVMTTCESVWRTHQRNHA